jgi:hypothetical protein
MRAYLKIIINAVLLYNSQNIAKQYEEHMARCRNLNVNGRYGFQPGSGLENRD